MNTWLLKTEPTKYSWDDLVKKGTDMWDGVRNFRARNNLKSMKRGDLAFIYHSVESPGIVGLAEVVNEFYPDPTASDGDWVVVDLKPMRKLDRFIPLREIKQRPDLQQMQLVRFSRLSVQKV
ncbi:MAG: EVE domain-containing protein, partial [Bacteroidales bacterium]|nr:EVE domain-containing protein [Bacteroidales bacterium]